MTRDLGDLMAKYMVKHGVTETITLHNKYITKTMDKGYSKQYSLKLEDRYLSYYFYLNNKDYKNGDSSQIR